MAEVVIDVSELAKTFRKPFTGKRVEAVKGVSFRTVRGEVFGFLGPNGAGKTTTIKMLTGLIRPTGGRALLLGMRAPSCEAMGRVGYLPESPYIYPYLTPFEFVSLCGRLNGLRGDDLRTRVGNCLERLGVSHAAHRAAGQLSKGMLQRVAFAAALVHDPQMLILDEPMSGLDPVGRKDIRDLILAERREGKTVFFSSHILSDVEMLCDRVAMLHRGQVVLAGSLQELLASTVRAMEVVADVSAARQPELGPAIERVGASATTEGTRLMVSVPSAELLAPVLRALLDSGASIESVAPRRDTLEALFVRLTHVPSDGPVTGARAAPASVS
jgi:ABC-2 type transport system ATP-binding protein